MKVATHDLKLVSVIDSPFKNSKGEEIKYVKSTLTDGEGNKFEIGTDVDNSAKLKKLNNVGGMATLDVYFSEFGGKKTLKMRLVDFIVSEDIID
jgi:hypothetical protein